MNEKNQEVRLSEPFKVVDIHKPTQQEVDDFNTMSPAQKVTWIKRHFRDAGIFKYIDTQLFNEYATRGRKAGTQTMSFKEDSVDRETIYKEFEEAFTNNNPLVASAAADIIKYAFFVEGYRMGMGNVSKMIPNSVLLNGGRIYGTNIISDTNAKMALIDEQMQGETSESVMENFIRSHSDTVGITYKKVTYYKGAYELTKRSHNLIHISGSTPEGKALAEKYGIISIQRDGVSTKTNTYVRLGFGKDTTLYKILEKNIGGTNIQYFLIPLNKLDTNENAEFSANATNNLYPSQDYYNILIDNYLERAAEITSGERAYYSDIMNEEVKKLSGTIDEYRAKNDFKVNKNQGKPIGNISKDAKYSKLLHQISDWYKSSITDGKPVKYLINSVLSESITGFGSDNGIVQKLTLDDGTIQTFRIYKMRKSEVERLIKKYTGKKINKAIETIDADLTEAIEALRSIAELNDENYLPLYYEDLYVVEPTDLDTEEDDDVDMSSTIYDVAAQAASGIYRRGRNIEDVRAGKISQLFRDKHVPTDTSSIAKTMDDVIIDTAKYLEETVNEIEGKLKHYIKDPETGEYLSVADEKCINIVKKDPHLRQEYLKLILEPGSIVEEFGLIKELDIESEDPHVQQYLNKIKTSVEKMQNLPLVAKAFEMFAMEYYNKETDNPLVRAGLITILQGYYSSTGTGGKLNSLFNDIQEASNPIVQIVMKNFQADLRAKEMNARIRADEFVKHIEEIKKAAKKAGKPFDFNHIIDEAGRFKQNYNSKLLEDRNRLKRAVSDAIKTTHPGSVEHMKAKLEYDEWKAKHLEQEVVQSYYDEKNAQLRRMLYNPSGVLVDATAKHFAKYQTLYFKRAELRNKYQHDAENEELDKEMDKLDMLIYDMQNSTDADDDDLKTLKNRLKSYIDEVRAIEHKYWKYDPVYNFDAVVEENRRIVESYELSGQPANLYSKNPEYVKAKNWLRRNVDIVPDYGNEESEYKVKAELEEAYNSLRGPQTQILARSIFNNKEYRNELGEFDPRLVPEEKIKKLKEEQNNHYKNYNETIFSDRTLINNGNPNPKIYNKDFYKGLVGLARGEVSKGLNPKWQEIVTNINDTLAPYYNEFTHEVDLHKIPHTPEGEAILDKLISLYERLSEIRGPKKSAATKKFIKENCEFTHNEVKFNDDVIWARGLPKSTFRTKLLDLIQDTDYDGNVVPNTWLYGFVIPKKSVEDRFIDKDKTNALETINKYKERKLSDAYWEAKYEASHNKSKEEYEKWYHNNHVYNPYSHSYEPLSIWWVTKDKADKYRYYPKFGQTQRVVRDGHLTKREANDELENYSQFDSVSELENHYFDDKDFRNKNYDPNGGHAGNYKLGSNSDYDNNFEANEYELEAMRYMQDTLLALANTQASKRYLKSGWLPARNKERPNDTRGWIKELAKTFGWANETFRNEDWYEEVKISRDTPPVMPMLEKLKNGKSKDLPKYPKRKEDESEIDYNKRLLEYEKNKEEIEKQNLEIHKSLLDTDWVNVISDFIVRAGKYNAVQDNKYELFYAQQLLKKYGHYVVEYNKYGKRHLKRNFNGNKNDDSGYLRQVDKNLVEQFDNQLRRVLYDQFKRNNNKKLLKWMSTLQSLTSAQYMMLNVKGGIANVTLGESQILGEAFAEEFFGLKHWAKGKMYYGSSITDYILHSYNDKAGTTAGAIIKFMDVVDYDEHSGVSRLTKDAYEALRKARNLAYTPQTAGEHGMQNSAMFSMMLSHRIFLNPREAEFGQPKYVYKNLMEHIRDIHEQALLSVLDDSEKKLYEKFKDNIRKNEDEFKDYAWYKKDVTSTFAREKLSFEKQEEFIKVRDKLVENAKKEFEDDTKHPTILSQLALGEDGKMTFAKDSMLAEIDIPKENGDPSDALQFIANFKGRVISVNKYIHGVYDKSGRAQIEANWWGSLLMQYHKHLPIGLMKRYRTEGMYSEERGAVTKGMYRSLFDFISIPFRKHQDVLKLTKEETDTLEATQNIFKNVIDFVLHMKTAYKLMPEYDRANIRRMQGDIYGILAAIALTIAIKAGADDDDEEGLLYNLALYETDRLATEAGQYIPFVAYTEAKKLWQSPVAAGSGITDVLSSMNMIAHMIIDGDEFDGEYHSGKFAGESKLKVYLERRIPIWRGIKSSFIDIKTNNHYYKIGDNMLNFIDTDKYAKKLKGKD